MQKKSSTYGNISGVKIHDKIYSGKIKVNNFYYDKLVKFQNLDNFGCIHGQNTVTN